jgi:phage shock protein A
MNSCLLTAFPSLAQMVAGLRLNNSSAWAAFDKMEEKVMAMESEAESAGLLATPDNIEAQFARLEGAWYRSTGGGG